MELAYIRIWSNELLENCVDREGNNMKKIATVLIIITTMALLLSGCMISANRGSMVDATLTLRNSTDYDIKGFALQFWGSTQIKRVNPMEAPLGDDSSLKPGEERTFDFKVGSNEVPGPWGVNFTIEVMETTCRSDITISLEDAPRYDITFGGFSDNEPQFIFTAY